MIPLMTSAHDDGRPRPEKDREPAHPRAVTRAVPGIVRVTGHRRRRRHLGAALAVRLFPVLGAAGTAALRRLAPAARLSRARTATTRGRSTLVLRRGSS